MSASAVRRFVVVAGDPIADGVQFSDGLIVARSRRSPPVEIYPGGEKELAATVRRGLIWLDPPLPGVGAVT